MTRVTADVEEIIGTSYAKEFNVSFKNFKALKL
jgi:hypothetical protein